MSLHVVLGKGPVGSTLADHLAGLGHEVRVLSRSGGSAGPTAARPTGAGAAVEHVAVDAADAAALSAAARGATALYNCANPAYHRWTTDWPPVAQALLTAAESTGAVLVVMSNLYGYGPVDGPITEDLPLSTTGSKGRVRVAMWQQALARHEAGALRMTEARGSDFVGPRVTDGGHLARLAVPRLLAGKTVRVIPDADVPHSWTSVVDVARTLAVLGSDERAWGRAWHVPTAPAVTVREAVQGLCAAAGVPEVGVRTLPHWAVRALGLAVPVLREMQEMRHSFTAPYLLDSSAVTATFGLLPTPLEQTWAQTVAWWRDQASHASVAASRGQQPPVRRPAAT